MNAPLSWTPADGSLIVAVRRKARACSHCSGPCDKPNQRYCRSCRAAYMRAWREAQPKPERRARIVKQW